MVPALIYIDSDLHHGPLKTLLTTCMEFEEWRGAPPVFAGGGWALSEGVRQAVTEVARERGLRLHVEQDQAWTLAGHLVRDTGNNSSSGGGSGSGEGGGASSSSSSSSGGPPPPPDVPTVTAAEAAAADALRVKDASLDVEVRRMAWIAAVFDAIDAGDDPVALAAAVGSHGRRRPGGGRKRRRRDGAPAAAAAPPAPVPPPAPAPAAGFGLAALMGTLPAGPPGASAALPPSAVLAAALAVAAPPPPPAASPPPADDDDSDDDDDAHSDGAGAGADAAEEVWIDSAAGDKRHSTPLMRAAKLGRTRCVTSLLQDHGAGVNVVADRSRFTALILAAYGGHEDAVRVLLAAGADAGLANKWGETALRAAQKAGKEGVVALLQAHDRAQQQQQRGASVGAGGSGW
jgi:hypothetical protein